MNAFWPVSSLTVAASSSPLAAQALGTGPVLRISRQTSADQVFINFGTASVVGSTTTGMELVSGVIEELEIPNPAIYTHFSVITVSGIVLVNVSTGPRYKVG